MALVSEQRSALNPNAPLFIPAAFRQVEDFSPKWWELVKTSTWFRDYWISEHQEDDFGGSIADATNEETVDMLPETFELSMEDDFLNLDAEFEELVLSSEAEHVTDPADSAPENAGKTQNAGTNSDAKALLKNLASPKSTGGRMSRSPVGPPTYHEKPARHVTAKCAPRRIQQPR